MNILLIGPVPPPIGGATVLFQQLVAELATEPQIDIKVVRTNPELQGSATKILHQIRAVWQIVLKLRQADIVSFHASISGGYKLSPFVHLACSVARKPWIFRGFGGNYSRWYAESPAWRQRLFRSSVLRADIVLLETQESVSFFDEVRPGGRLEWYPNSRPLQPVNAVATESIKEKRETAAGATRFVFLGHVQPSKGVLVLREAAQRLATGLSIDVYGPLLGGLDATSVNGEGITYRGVLAPEQVSMTLMDYDVLVFPTMYAGEGYPGVILEAYTRGLPVITTRFRSIPEIVDESSGILVEPGDAVELAAAINALSLDRDLFAALRDGAQQKAKEFESRAWTVRFVELCAELVASSRV